MLCYYILRFFIPLAVGIIIGCHFPFPWVKAHFIEKDQAQKDKAKADLRKKGATL